MITAPPPSHLWFPCADLCWSYLVRLDAIKEEKWFLHGTSGYAAHLNVTLVVVAAARRCCGRRRRLSRRNCRCIFDCWGYTWLCCTDVVIWIFHPVTCSRKGISNGNASIWCSCNGPLIIRRRRCHLLPLMIKGVHLRGPYLMTLHAIKVLSHDDAREVANYTL